nr:hypothetical protein [Tanacetum cinerariifolium]
IETRVTRQYKVLVFSSKLFANMRLNFSSNPMPLLLAMLLQAQAGEGFVVGDVEVDEHEHLRIVHFHRIPMSFSIQRFVVGDVEVDEHEHLRIVHFHRIPMSFSIQRFVLEEPPTKKPKSPEAPTPSMLEIPISPAVTSPPSSHTRRKSFGRKHMHKPKSKLPTLDLDAHAQAFLKVIVDEDCGT